MTREEKAQRRAQMQAYKAEGHSLKETAEAFGVSKGYATQVCKGIAPQTQRRPKHYRNQYANEDGSRILETISRYSDTFEYAGNYTGTDGTVDLRCIACGTVVTKSWVTVRHPKCRGVCPECQRREAERKAEEKARKKADDAKLAEVRHILCITKNATQMEMKQCPVCGEMFTATRGRTYCSDRCTRAQLNSVAKDKRVRKIRDVVDDKGITLENVAKKDKDICWICGKLVNWTAFYMRGETFIAEDDYPSIDHVVPLAKGGRHSWKNVRLAHRRCNYLKSDTSPVAEK